MNLDEARLAAWEIIFAISPYCVPGRCQVAGGVRRGDYWVDNIEIVATPILNDFEKLDALRKIVNNRWGVPTKGPFPSRQTTVRGRYSIDFYWQDKRTYGMNLFIRTGSERFVQDALRYWGDLTKVGDKSGYSEGALLHLADGTIVPTETEEAVFEALQCKFIPPERRNRP